MTGKDTIVVDYSKIKYYDEIHTILRDAMGWPKWYGCNLDALWDIFDCVPAPRKVVFTGTQRIYQHEGWGENWEKMLRILDEVCADFARFGQEFVYEIRD